MEIKLKNRIALDVDESGYFSLEQKPSRGDCFGRGKICEMQGITLHRFHCFANFAENTLSAKSSFL